MNYMSGGDRETEAAAAAARSHDEANLTLRRPPRRTRSRPRPKVGCVAGNHLRSRHPNQIVRPPILQLEVCHGPDCFGSGGGAAMLEIEELVQEHHHVQQQQDAGKDEEGDNTQEEEEEEGGGESPRLDELVVKVVKGGCRNFCSMGPNVHVSRITSRRNRSSSSKSTAWAKSKSPSPTTTTRHFTKVNNVKECHLIVQSIIADNDCYGYDDGDKNIGGDGDGDGDNSTTTTTTNIARRMLIQRSERKRWEFLREMARSTKMKNKSNKKKQEQQQKEYQTRQRQTQVVSRTYNNGDDDVRCGEDLRRHQLDLLLEEAIAVEINAAKTDPGLISRCQRRKHRLQTMLVELDEEEEEDSCRTSSSGSEDVSRSSSSSSSMSLSSSSSLDSD